MDSQSAGTQRNVVQTTEKAKPLFIEERLLNNAGMKSRAGFSFPGKEQDGILPRAPFSRENFRRGGCRARAGKLQTAECFTPRELNGPKNACLWGKGAVMKRHRKRPPGHMRGAFS